MASEIWSANLSGWASLTDSEVKVQRFKAASCCPECRGSRLRAGP